METVHNVLYMIISNDNNNANKDFDMIKEKFNDRIIDYIRTFKEVKVDRVEEQHI